jgi:hypothetical protein
MTDTTQTITIDHVRALLAAGSGAVLALIEGRVELIDADHLDSEEFRGALEVIGQGDLAERVGADPTDEALAAEAAALTVAVNQIGG